MSDTQTIDIDYGWWATLEPHGPWLCVRLHPAQDDPAPGPGLIERLWGAIRERDADEVVLEMDDVAFLPSSLMCELVRLHKRLASHDGRLRITGLRPPCAEALRLCRLDQVLPTYPGRQEAVQ